MRMKHLLIVLALFVGSVFSQNSSKDCIDFIYNDDPTGYMKCLDSELNPVPKTSYPLSTTRNYDFSDQILGYHFVGKYTDLWFDVYKKGEVSGYVSFEPPSEDKTSANRQEYKILNAAYTIDCTANSCKVILYKDDIICGWSISKVSTKYLFKSTFETNYPNICYSETLDRKKTSDKGEFTKYLNLGLKFRD